MKTEVREKPLVSVVIPNYNYAHFLNQCLDSVLAQTYPHWEILVVDDNSSDGSRQLVEAFIDRFPDRRIRLIHNPDGPRGTNTPINIGIRNMEGELFAWLSSDDFFLPDKLERQVRLMISRPDVAMVHTGFHTVDEQGRRTGITTATDKDHKKLFLELFEKPGINGSTVLVRKRVFDHLGLFVETHPEMPPLWRVGDHLKWMEIALYYPVGAVPEPLHCFRIHEANAPFNEFLIGRRLIPIAQTLFTDQYTPEQILERLGPESDLGARFLSLASCWFLKNHLFEKAFQYLMLLDPADRESILAEQRRSDLDRHRRRAACDLWDIGQTADAEAVAALTSRMPDEEALADYREASWLESHGHPGEAEDRFRRLLLFRHETPEVITAGAHFHLGRILLEKGDLPEARDQLVRSLQYNPDHAEARRLLDRVEKELTGAEASD